MSRLGWPCCALVAGVLGASGCCYFGQQSCRPLNGTSSAYPCYDPYRRSALLPLHPLTPCRTAPVPGPPPPAVVNVLPPGSPGAVPTSPPIVQGYPPADAGPQVRLSPPETEQPPLATVPPQPGVGEARSGAGKPGYGEERAATPSLQLGIPQFAMARKRVATGLRPILDGLDALANNGYRTVLHLRLPGQDDTADKKQFEQRGLRFVSLEVSPETLSRELVDQFNNLVTDAGVQPLFVYDRDGSLAGGLWYLHFRTVEGASDEDALARATRLGLRTDTREGKDMLVAVQKYLSGQKP